MIILAVMNYGIGKNEVFTERVRVKVSDSTDMSGESWSLPTGILKLYNWIPRTGWKFEASSRSRLLCNFLLIPAQVTALSLTAEAR